jgi:hypothetical protein
MIQATSYLDRVLEPLADCLNAEAACRILNVTIDPTIQARVAVLAERANEWDLSAEERAEYLGYAEASDLLSIFKLMAQRHLHGNRGGASGRTRALTPVRWEEVCPPLDTDD